MSIEAVLAIGLTLGLTGHPRMTEPSGEGDGAGAALAAHAVAMLECEVPDLDTFVVHGPMPVPPGFTFRRGSCPFTIYDGLGNPLPTQWEAIAYRADGSLMTVELLGVAPRGGRPVGSRQLYPVRLATRSDPIPSVAEAAELVRDLVLRGEDVFGNRYEGSFSSVRFHRLGAAQVTAMYTTRLLPVSQGAPGTLEQLGAAQAWFSVRAGTDVVEMALNFHNASSAHPSANLYFRRLELVLPDDYGALSMWPEPMAGTPYAEGTSRVLPLIAPIPTGQVHFLEQRHERGFRYFLHRRDVEARDQALVLRERKGWARLLDLEATEQRSWSFSNEETPGYFPQALPTPSLAHVANIEGLLAGRRNGLWDQVSRMESVGPYDHIPLPSSFRNPYGVQYGGMTSGLDLNPYEGIETLWSGSTDGLLEAYLLLRCTNDRQPGAIYEEDGRSFDVDDPRYLNADGSQPYSIYNNVFRGAFPSLVHDAPWNWHAADGSHEWFVEGSGLAPPYRENLASFDPIDTQHMFRYSRVLKALVYLDNDPMAHLYMEAASSLLRATYYEGPGGRLASFLDGEKGIGSDFGREHAQAGDLAAAAYACGDEHWRASWKPWFETYLDVLAHVQTPGGVWLAATQGKAAVNPPLGNGQVAYFRSMRPNEHTYTLHGLRAVKEAVFAHGADPVRHGKARFLLRRGGRAMWSLLWKWKPDGSGPAGNGTWDRVAVGPVGSDPVMFTSHADHPAAQYDPSIVLDSYRTGLGLTYWLVESDLNPEMRTALASYFSTWDFRGAALASGLSNIWNDASLLSFVQRNL